MKTITELCQPTELSCQILNDLAVKYAKEGPPIFYALDDIKLPERSIDLYGEEPKRFVWSKLSTEYDWEQCI